MPPKNADEGLKRVVGIFPLATTVVNNIIGAGIYALPAIVSIQMGASGILSYLFCGIMLAAIMTCYIEIGSRVTDTGGSYAYVQAGFGPLIGFIINWLFFFGWGVLGSAALMNIVADSLAVLFPVFSNFFARALLYLIILGGLTALNIYGTKQSVRFVQFITFIKLLPLFAIIIFGFSYVKTDNLRWEHLPSLKLLGNTSLVLFFAFAGFETSLSVSGEIKNPKRTIPAGILLGGAFVLIIYLFIQIIAQGVLGNHIGEFKDAPLAAVAEKIIGPTGATILLVAAAVSSLGNTSGDILSSPRLLFAGAKDGLFPKFLGSVHPKFVTPYWAVIVYASLIFIFSIAGGFKQLAIMASCALLIIYLTVILSMVKLRFKKDPLAEKTFKAPGGLIIPFIAIASIIWLLLNSSLKEILATAIFIAVVCIIYFVMKKYRNGIAP